MRPIELHLTDAEARAVRNTLAKHLSDKDAAAQLSATNDKIKTFDVSTLYDASLVQSAMDRHVGGP